MAGFHCSEQEGRTVIRDRILKILASNPAGLGIEAITDALGDIPGNQGRSAVEVLLVLSPDIVCDGGYWRLAARSREHRILDAIEKYAERTGKKIFRLSAALNDFAPEEMPMADELTEFLKLGGQRFELLANAMIKRNI